MRAWVLACLAASLGAGSSGCATQHQTAQALTIVGAAAVIVGASMAADEQCVAAAPGGAGASGDCAPGFSKGTRTAGKGLAAAGVGLAAAGYALTPRGPDRTQAPPQAAAPAAPYRLIRRAPPPEEPAPL